MENPEYSLRQPEKPPQEPASINKKAPTAVPIPDNTAPQNEAPLIFEYFDVKGWPEMLLNPRLDSRLLIGKVAEIESFLRSHLDAEGLKPGKESFDQMLRAMEEELRLTPQHEAGIRIDKVHALMKIVQKAQSARERKKSILRLLNH